LQLEFRVGPQAVANGAAALETNGVRLTMQATFRAGQLPHALSLSATPRESGPGTFAPIVA